MGTVVDDLKIKLEAEAKSAESELDKVIGKVGNLEKTISNIGKGGVATKAFSSLTTGVKKNISDMNSYVDKAAQEMSKSLIKAFDIKGDIGKKAVENLTRDLTMATAKLGKAKAQGQDTSALGAEAKGIRENLVNTIKDLSQVSLAAEKPLQDFVSTIQSISQISVGSEFFKTHPGNMGVDGSLIGRFTKDSGIKLDSLWQDLARRFPDLIKHDTNAGDQANVINDIFKQYRDSANSSGNKDLIASGAKNEINEFITSVKNDMLDMFKTADTRIEEIRARVGDTGKDFANTGGVNLRTPQAIQKAIDNATAQMHKQRETAELSGVGTKGWNSAIERSIVLENHVASLQEKLSQLNMDDATASADRMARATANIDAAIKRILGDTTEMAEEEEVVDTGAKTLKLDLMAMANSVSTARTEMSQMPQTADETGNAVERTERKASVLSQTFHNISKSIKDELGKGFNIVIPREEFKELQNEIDKSKEKLNKLQAMMERGLTTNKDFAKTTTFKKLQYDIEETSNSLKHLEGEMADMGKYTHTLNWDMIGGGIKKSFGESIAIIRKATSAVGSFVSKLGAPINNAIKNMTKSIGKFSIANMGLVKSLSRTVKMLRLMVVRMALRGVINEAKDSFKELIGFSDKAANSFNLIRNAIHYLADTLAALISPIWNASSTFSGLGAIIDSITDKIVDLINKFNQLLAALLGHSTWIKAKKQTHDYASELDKSKDKAKKALQAFDELNNLTSNSHGIAGQNNDSGKGHFEELPLDDKWKKMAQWLKDMWSKADFTELGELFAKKLKEMLQAIPWDYIKYIAGKIGKSLATFLNGVFKDKELARTIGNTIAQAINTALTFAYEFVKYFKFKQFGEWLGELLSSSLRNVEWKKFRDLAKGIGSGIARAINGLLSTDVLYQIGNALGNVLRAAIDLAFNIVTGIEFDKLGEKLISGFKRFFKVMGETDETKLNGWQKLGKTISDALIGVLKTLNTVLSDETLRSEVGKAITDFFNQIDFGEIFRQSAELIGNIARGLATVIIAALKSENFREGLRDIGGIIASVFAAKLAFDAIGSVFKMVAARIAKVFLLEIGSNLATYGFAGLFKPLIDLGINLVGWFGNVFTMVGEVVTEGLAAVSSTILGVVGGIVAFFEGAEIGKLIGYTLLPDDAELYESYMGIEGTLRLINDTADAFYDDLGFKFEAWWNYQKGWLEKAKEWIKQYISDEVDRFKMMWATIVKDATKFKDDVTVKAKELANGIKQKSEELAEFIKHPFETLKQFILNLINSARTWGYNLITAIANGITGGSSNLINAFGTAVKNAAENAFNNSLVGRAVNYIRGNSEGGILVNGKWQPIQGYASGGIVSADMFMARENGMPEMVGRIGSHTAVANNDQIVASVSDGVYRAVRAAMNGQSDTNVNIELVGDTAKLFKAIRKEGSEYQRRTGNPVWA